MIWGNNLAQQNIGRWANLQWPQYYGHNLKFIKINLKMMMLYDIITVYGRTLVEKFKIWKELYTS